MRFSMFSEYLTFSDAAKYADIARNIVEGKGWGSLFSFFDPRYVNEVPNYFEFVYAPPIMPYAIAVFFKIFGVSDASVIATSFFFLFLTAIFTFLLGKKLFGKTVGVLSALVVLINQNFLDYAKTGASETLFMFEIVAIPYLMLIKKRWATITSFLLLVICYFTRPQAFIFISGYVLLYLILKYDWKKALAIFAGVSIIAIIADRLILLPLNGKYFLYSITGRGEYAIVQHSQYVAVSDVLRGVEKQPSSLILTIKKTGTHLFNFYRSLPNIANPYLFVFFILSPLVLFKKKEERAFLIVVFFTTALSFLLPALTIPFYRYIHPVLPLIYITGIGSMITIINEIIKSKNLNPKQIQIFKIQITKRHLTVGISSLLIVFFVLIMQVGIFIHDSKYYEVRTNPSKPPVYTVLSWKLKEVTQPDDFIVTNLDTWGSWYGERKTMWFPLEPEQLDIGGETKIDAIYLTSYLIDDENYYMGSEWRQIFENPENIENEFIRDNFEFAGEFEISADEIYEKYDARAILLTKKQ